MNGVRPCSPPEALGRISDFLSIDADIRTPPIRLMPHIDLPNYNRSPDYQFLYSIHNEAEGGQSIFVDGKLQEIRFNNWIRDTRPDVALEDEKAFYQINLKLRGGEMVAFDNRRVLHGREAFNPNTGKRFLQGLYVEGDFVRSRLRVLERTAPEAHRTHAENYKDYKHITHIAAETVPSNANLCIILLDYRRAECF